jgi:ABC-2 type transport system ATP-binding protein
MSDSILIAQDIYKSYGDHHAVRGISLDVKRGEIFGLLGPNGAGKTTMISILTGLIEPTLGKILVDGLEFTPQAKKVKAKIGLVPQELALYPTLSARDNLVFFGRIYGLRGNELKARVNTVLEMVDLTDRANDAIRTYSGGMKRRINIAAGLLHEPEILFLDEPTVGVDPQSRNAILESVEGLNKAGLTVLYTTHYMEEAQRLCDRLAILDQGKIVAMDMPQRLIRSLGDGIVRLGLHNGHVRIVTEQGLKHPAIKKITYLDERLIVETHQAQDALMGLLEITNKIGARVTSLEVLEPNLETVFLQLTGKSLRDG